MRSQPVILLLIARRGWTLSAVHAACQLAHEIDATILLVKMVGVQHLGWLGTELGYMDFTFEEQAEMTEYEEIIAEYDVEFTCYIYQYVSLFNAIVQMAEQARPQVAFATLPPSLIPGWRNFQLDRLRQQLLHDDCELIEKPISETTIVETPISETVERSLTPSTGQQFRPLERIDAVPKT